MRPSLLVFLAAGFVIAADEPKKELQGAWKLVSLEVNGEKATKGEIKKEQRMVVKGDKFQSTVNDKHTFKGTFKTDLSKKPKAVDFTVTEGEFEGKTLLGIYEVEGDTLRACYASPGKDRPTEFISKKGSGTYLYVYKREK